MEYLKRDQLQVAQEKIEKALVQNPQDVNVQLAAGLVYERLQENKVAEKHFRLALQGRAGQPGGAERARRLLLPQQAAGEGRGDVPEGGDEPAVSHAIRRLHERRRVRAQCRRSRAGGALPAPGAHRRRSTIPKPTPSSPACCTTAATTCRRARSSSAILAVAPATPEMLLLGYNIEVAIKDEAAAAAFRERLEKEFPDSEQLRRVDRLPARNSG